MFQNFLTYLSFYAARPCVNPSARISLARFNNAADTLSRDNDNNNNNYGNNGNEYANELLHTHTRTLCFSFFFIFIVCVAQT